MEEIIETANIIATYVNNDDAEFKHIAHVLNVTTDCLRNALINAVHNVNDPHSRVLMHAVTIVYHDTIKRNTNYVNVFRIDTPCTSCNLMYSNHFRFDYDKIITSTPVNSRERFNKLFEAYVLHSFANRRARLEMMHLTRDRELRLYHQAIYKYNKVNTSRYDEKMLESHNNINKLLNGTFYLLFGYENIDENYMSAFIQQFLNPFTMHYMLNTLKSISFIMFPFLTKIHSDTCINMLMQAITVNDPNDMLYYLNDNDAEYEEHVKIFTDYALNT